MGRLTKKQQELFDALHNDRVEDYKVFSKRDYGGLFKSVIDKYPESAHFIYELLQNADDANATEVNIILKKDSLLFKHNGTKHFDVTPIDSVEVGDINAITGIGNSTKIETQNKIGKFGVGFKSVFQYSDTPEIYDDIYKFKIENYIIPTLIEEDRVERKKGETLFVFHFRNAKSNYHEIKKRLENLRNPIIFLHNLIRIVLRIDDTNDKYTYEKTLRHKEEYNQYNYGNVKMELYDILEPKGLKSIILFSQNVIVNDNYGSTIHPIYVGFYYNEEKQKLITANSNRKVYCFFPTKESFKTCFILHAPFLLTDNRQNLKPNEKLNDDLVSQLSKLAAQSVIILRDWGEKQNNLLINENITEILPQYDMSDRYGTGYEYKMMFEESFKKIMREKRLLLSRNGNYIYENSSYTTPGSVYELVDKKQFNTLRKTQESDFLKWELIQNIRKCKDDNNYFMGIHEYSIEDFARDISKDFMNQQSKPWILKFYTFVREEGRKYWVISNQTKGSSLAFRDAPIIKNQRGEWVPPFKNKTLPNVYFPIGSESSAEYNFVHREYMSEEMAKKLFTAFEFKQPETYDYIRNVVLKKYDEENVWDITDETIIDDFTTLLNYYREIRGTIKESQFIKDLYDNYYLMGNDKTLHRPNTLYADNETLKKYFEGNSDVDFFDSSFYTDALKGLQNTVLIELVNKLITNKIPNIVNIEFVRYSTYRIPEEYRNVIPQEKMDYYNDIHIKDVELIGFEKACEKRIITKEVSIFLWNDVVCHYLDIPDGKILASTTRRSTYDLFSIDNKYKRDLLKYSWLYNSSGELIDVDKAFQEELCKEYDLKNGVKEFLGIKRKIENLTEKYGATKKEQDTFEYGSHIKNKFGELTEEEREEALEKKKASKQKDSQKKESLLLDNLHSTDTDNYSIGNDGIADKLNKKWEEKKNKHIGKPHSFVDGRGFDLTSIESPETISSSNNDPFFIEQPEQNHQISDNQNNTARAEKNLKSKDTSAQNQAEEAKEQVAILDLLNETKEYSFKWFKLIMELMHAGQHKKIERNVQIDFSHFDTICSDKILHLTEPSVPVPVWCCDAEKYTIMALADGQSFKIDGFIVNSSDNSIDISIEINDQILQACIEAKKIRVIATDNTDIIDSLETRFLQLDKEDDFDMNKNLPPNLEFIYGPPGTGKTTELVQQVHEIIVQNPNAKILVLTPTNKAADVVALKLSSDNICYNYLSRYGATESMYLIEEVACVTNRDTTDMDMYGIVVATAARYAYDFIQPDDTAICDYPWDYIFIDEASMIDIITITYILYKGACAKKIIISGDPKQIQPVVQNDMPAYNVYHMISLHGFANAIENFKRYPVHPLMIQHRSVPSIGELVSKFAYDGLLKFDTNRSPQKPLQIDGLPIKDINFLGYEVTELDEIKGLTSIGQSAFHLYSVILTYNMVEYITKQVAIHYPNINYSIGIVCTYRAQADAIKKMLESRPLNTQNCNISCGTVHSFQGDECDIMFIVLNPPAVCTSGTHVNNENIINVAMSRAKDYLFFVLPKGQQKGFFMKNRIGNALQGSDSYITDCRHVEHVIFNNDNYIYENTHVTCHMPVNVFSEDNAIYQVKMSEDAIDIKINR